MTAKPATPLPYAVGVTDKQPYALRIYAVAPGPEFDFSVAWVRDVDAATLEQNAAYIVHACNAYPQLVADRAELIETLKYVLVDEPNLIPCALSSCRNVIRNLLRDLGEAQS